MAISPLRFITTRSPSLLVTVLMLMNLRKPSLRDSSVVCSARRLAVPPMWKVRMVSCVPGSPID